MKKTMIAIAIVSGIISCGDANDGNAATDTTSTIPVDTAVLKNDPTDTGQFNTNTGTFSTDTGMQKKNDVRSSSSAYPDVRGVRKDSVPQ